MSVEAWNPTPADGARFVPAEPDVLLSWDLGDTDTTDQDLKWDIYYGTDKTAVETATVPNYTDDAADTDTTGSYTLLAPPKATTYYWRVDTKLIGGPDTVPPFKVTLIPGKVWQFETLKEIPVRDLDIVLWLKLDENVIDYSGNGNHGTIGGDPQYVAGGMIDGAMEFDGIDDHINCGDDAELRMTDNFSVACWVKAAENGFGVNWAPFVSFRGENNRGWQLRRRGSSNGACFTTRTSGTQDPPASSNIQDGEWHHVVGTYQSFANSKILYVDGEAEIVTSDHTDPIVAPNGDDRVVIGARIQNNNSGNSEAFIRGSIDDVRIYSRVLTPIEVLHIMDYRKAYNPSPADGEYDVPLTTKLTWNAGDDDDTGLPFTKHDVYFGTVFEDVNSGTVPTATVNGINEWTPPVVDYSVRYYWRIDGVGSYEKGHIWTFKTIYDATKIVDPNLVGWWKLDGDGTDSSGYGNHGTEVGDVFYTTGVIDEAISGDNDGDYLACGAAPKLAVTDAITIALWINHRPGGAGNARGLLGHGGGWSDQGYTFWHDDFSNIRPELNGPNNKAQATALPPPDNEWHHVAFTWEDVTDAIIIYINGEVVGTGTFIGPLGVAQTELRILAYNGDAQERDRYFNGMADDVRIYDKALSQEEIITIVRINLAWAYNPRPAHGATGVELNPALSWTPGDYQTGHRVSFGDDPAALVEFAPQGANNVAVGPLELGKAYYWAVDEANAAALGGYDLGRIWKFTTSDFVTVEDFEFYDWDRQLGEDANWVYYVWTDGLANFLYLEDMGGNGTGANLYVQEGTILDGIRGLRFDYDNDGFAENPRLGAQLPRAFMYSMARASTADLPSGIGSDWTADGAKVLSIPFYGDSLNDIEPMWVELEDGAGRSAKVTYGDYDNEEPNDITEGSWHDWYIALQDFNDLGIDLEDVNSIALGFGDVPALTPGGMGIVHFDEIRLYAPICVLSRRSEAFAAIDYAEDCQINYGELEVMFDHWLEFDYEVTPAAPDPCGLVAWYKFEGNANDSSDNDLHGTEQGGLTYMGGQVGQAIRLDGIDDYVGTGRSLLSNVTQFTVAGWVNVQGMIDGRVGLFGQNDAVEFGFQGGDLHCWTAGGGGEARTAWTQENNTWHHVAAVANGNSIVLYADGQPIFTGGSATASYGSSTFAFNIGGGGVWDASDNWFTGQIDEVRVYNYALSNEEIVSVQGLGTVYVPVISPANISDDEPKLEKIVNFKDYDLLLSWWLVEDFFE